VRGVVVMGVMVRVCMTMLVVMVMVMCMIVPSLLRRVVRLDVIMGMMMAVVLPMVVSMVMVAMFVARVVMPMPMVMIPMPVVLVRMVMIMPVPIALPAILTLVRQHHVNTHPLNALAHAGRHPQLEFVVQPQLRKLGPQVVRLHAKGKQRGKVHVTADASEAIVEQYLHAG